MTKDNSFNYLNKVPKTLTLSASNYIKAYYNIHNFFLWVTLMATRLDETRKIAMKALYEEYSHDKIKNKEKIIELEYENLHDSPMLDTLRNNRQLFVEIILSRHIDNYLNYLSEVLSEIYIQKPETLRSSEKILSIDNILDHASIADLIKTVSEKKVESLSYKSFGDLYDFFYEKFKVDIFMFDKDIIIEAIETRNIAIHNRCIINERYCIRTDTDYKNIGQLRTLGVKELDDIIPKINASILELDKNIRKKLKVKGIRHSSKNG